jgi:hypothetical protein
MLDRWPSKPALLILNWYVWLRCYTTQPLRERQWEKRDRFSRRGSQTKTKGLRWLGEAPKDLPIAWSQLLTVMAIGVVNRSWNMPTPRHFLSLVKCWAPSCAVDCSSLDSRLYRQGYTVKPRRAKTQERNRKLDGLKSRLMVSIFDEYESKSVGREVTNNMNLVSLVGLLAYTLWNFFGCIYAKAFFWPDFFWLHRKPAFLPTLG